MKGNKDNHEFIYCDECFTFGVREEKGESKE